MSVAHSQITTSRQVSIPKGHRIYTTTRRQCAIEMPVPTQGQTMAAFLGAGSTHAANIVLDAWDTPTGDGKKAITVEHTAVPSGTHVYYETVPYRFPPIYPNGTSFFPGGSYSRTRNVVGEVTYEFTRDPSAWAAAAVLWNFSDPSTGPFEVRSYIAQVSSVDYLDADDNLGTIGEFLAGSFIYADTIHNVVNISIPKDIAYSSPASVPSATTYATWVSNGTKLMVSRTIDDWYGDIYMRRTVKVRAQ